MDGIVILDSTGRQIAPCLPSSHLLKQIAQLKNEVYQAKQEKNNMINNPCRNQADGNFEDVIQSQDEKVSDLIEKETRALGPTSPKKSRKRFVVLRI